MNGIGAYRLVTGLCLVLGIQGGVNAAETKADFPAKATFARSVSPDNNYKKLIIPVDVISAPDAGAKVNISFDALHLAPGVMAVHLRTEDANGAAKKEAVLESISPNVSMTPLGEGKCPQDTRHECWVPADWASGGRYEFVLERVDDSHWRVSFGKAGESKAFARIESNTVKINGLVHGLVQYKGECERVPKMLFQFPPYKTDQNIISDFGGVETKCERQLSTSCDLKTGTCTIGDLSLRAGHPK